MSDIMREMLKFGIRLESMALLGPKFYGYYISESGDVYSDKSGEFCKLSQFRVNGYRAVSIGRRNHKIARLVCTVFNGPCPPGKSFVRHLDGIRTNDMPQNLRWGTPKENTRDALNHGTFFRAPKRPHVPKGPKRKDVRKLTQSIADEIRARVANGETPTAVSKDYDIHRNTIHKICRGVSWVKPDTVPVKMKNGAAVLTQEQVDAIRASKLSRPEIAALYNISRASVTSIRLGHSWKSSYSPEQDIRERGCDG